MIPDWVTYAKDAIEAGSVLLGVLGGVWRMGYRLGQQDKQLEWQSRALEAMAKKTGSDPPPRPKLATLTDPFEEIMREARKNERKE